MINISEPIKDTSPAIWQLPFRSFFLTASLFSVIALTLWLLYLLGYIVIPQIHMLSLIWHIHEMIFGFGALVAVGFVLTAVQTWTGQPSISGTPVIALLFLWLIARIVFLLSIEFTLIPLIIVQFLWWLAVIGIFAKLVISAQNRRNYLFIYIFSALATFNLTMLLATYANNPLFATYMGKAAVLMFSLLMGLMGGRVIPFFTARGASVPAIQPNAFIEKALPILSVTSIVLFVANHFLALSEVLAVFLIFTGTLNIIRQMNWNFQATYGIPLLWSLHAAYFSMSLGLIGVGASYLMPQISFSSALHLITVGAMGLMIFAMMSRVSLGHTGRPLTTSKWINLSFGLMIFSALTRSVLSNFGFYKSSWIFSVLSWVIAGLIFFTVYYPILSKPKQQ